MASRTTQTSRVSVSGAAASATTARTSQVSRVSVSGAAASPTTALNKSGFACGNMHDSAFRRKADAQRDGNVMPIAQSWAEIIIPVFAVVSALLLLERRIARLEARVEFIVQRLFPLDERE
jgi:hypothetical protein